MRSGIADLQPHDYRQVPEALAAFSYSRARQLRMVNISGLVLALSLGVAAQAPAIADEAVPWRSQVFPCMYATLSHVERELIVDTTLIAQASAMIDAAVEPSLREIMNEVADLVPPDAPSNPQAESLFDNIDPIVQRAGAQCGVPDLTRGEVNTFKSYFLGHYLKNRIN